MMTLFDAKKKAIQLIKDAGSPSPILDVNCLLQFLLNKDSTYILTHNQLELTKSQVENFFSMVEKRQTGLPIAYIIGSKEFYSLDFFVTPSVLIPKADTEILVEHAIEKISCYPKDKISIIDVCTGSGCIGISVLKNCLSFNKEFTLTLTDISKDALAIAKKNVNAHLKNFTSIELLNGDLLCNKKSFDFILSNPPYVPHSQVEELLTDGRNEPRLALDGDIDSFVSKECYSDDGLLIIKRLIPMAYDALNLGGMFLMESGEYQVKEVCELFKDAAFSDVYYLNDLSGQPRVTVGIK